MKMKKITRLVCLVLCLVMLVPMAAACSKDSTYGAQINMYLSEEVYKLDPAYATLDSSAGKLISLLFEGLVTLDDDGDIKKALLKDYEYTVDEGVRKDDPSDNTYTMVIELKPSAWSDGTAVSANDFAYAWRRILSPEFDCEAAVLLYDIKNAKAHKTTGISVDDVGIKPDKNILTIEFEHDIDPEEFLRKTASVALVPLRNTVDTYYDWSSSGTTIVTNGQFMVRTYYPGLSMQLVRNSYYHRDISDKDSTPSPTKYVKPYAINIDFQLNGEQMMQKFEDGELFYIGELPLDKEIRKQYENKVELMNTLSTHTYMFNVNKAPFDNKTVRQVLSKVIDRNEIVSEIVFAYAATGFVPGGINDKSEKDDFASNSSTKINSGAMDISDAITELRNAGINPSSYGKLKLTVKVDAISELDADGEVVIGGLDTDVVDYLVAEKVIEKWNALGFDFEIEAVNAERYKESTSAMVQYRDMQSEIIFGTYKEVREYVSDTLSTPHNAERATFDVIAIDNVLTYDDAFCALAVYARQFSGSVMVGDFVNDEIYGHMSGFKSDAYDAIINEAYAAKIAGNTELLSQKLHEAEAMLLDEMPCIPVFVYKDAVLIHDDLSKVKFDYYGAPIFSKVRLKNWKDLLPADETGKDD